MWDEGDCSLIRLPFNQGNYLIDTGGNREYDIASHNVIPFLKSQGVPCIDRVYISHHDYDHYGALESLKKKYKSKGFAAGCSREVIERGAEQLGWGLDELLTKTLAAMAASEDIINEEMEKENV